MRSGFNLSNTIIVLCFVLFSYCGKPEKESKSIESLKTTSEALSKEDSKKELITINKTNITNQEWITYFGQTGEQEYILKIRGISKSEIEFRFLKKGHHESPEEYSGILNGAHSASNLIIRYETKSRGLEFKDSNGELSLQLERGQSRYARFSKYESSILIRKDIKEPYEEYIPDLLEKLQVAKRKAFSKSVNNPNNISSSKKQYFGLIGDVWDAFQFIEEANGYNVRNDSSLLEIAIYLELDSVIEILEEKEVVYKEYVPNEIKPIIHKEFEGYLFGEIKLGSGNSIFERIELEIE